jgi:hypothetical protein
MNVVKQSVLFITLLWWSISVHAHGFDYSVVRLTETENHTWRLAITSSLDAFRKEVRLHFSKTPYSTPEEFNEQLLNHISATLSINAELKSISLGHETSVVFTQIKLPKSAKQVVLTNGAIKDIYRHTTKLIVTPLGAEKQSFILNKSNNFTATIPLH